MSPDTTKLTHITLADDGLGLPLTAPDLPCCEDDVPDPLAGLPPRAIDALTASADELSAAERGAKDVLEDLYDAVMVELSPMSALMDSFGDGLLGQLDIELSKLEDHCLKIVMALMRSADKEIEQCIEWLLNVQIRPPYHPAEMVAAMQGDWLQMLIDAVPAVGTALMQPQQPAEGDTLTEGDTTYGDQYSSSGANGPAAGGGGGWIGSSVGVGSPGATVPGIAGSAGGSTTTTVTATGGGEDVTVNVYLPPAPPSPPMAPPPSPVGIAPGLATGGQPGGNTPVAPGTGSGTVPQSQLLLQQLQQQAAAAAAAAPPPGSVPYTLPGLAAPPPLPGALAPLSNVPIPGLATGIAGKVLTDPLAFPLHTSILPVVDAGSRLDAVDWNNLDSCGHATTLSKAPLANIGTPGKGQPKSMLENYFEGKMQLKNWFPVLLGPLGVPFELKQLADAWAASESAKSATIDSVMGAAAQETIIGSLGPNAVPNKAAASFFGSKLAAGGWVQDKTHFPMDYLLTSDRYLFQFANPQELPNQVKVDDAFLSNSITLTQWECWTKANGNLPGPAGKVVEGNQTRPEIGDIIQLFRRGHMTRDVLNARLRQKGVIDPSYVPEYLAVTTALPTQSDLVTFMVRDSADQSVATLYEYDKGFTDKYTPQIETWAKSLGLDETYFRYMWRAHWQIPSYTQLSEMFHRLRPDRQEVLEWDREAEIFTPGAQEVTHGPRPRVVTREEVREALEINDMAPYWVQPLIEIAYNPITRTDAVRAYMIGAFTEQQMREAFLDVGYSPRNADLLVEFHRQEKARRRANVTGTWSPRKITAYYKAGKINRQKAEQLMAPLAADRAEVTATLDAADDETAADTRGVAIAGVRRGLIVGEHSSREAAGLLIQFGVDPIAADRLMTNWTIQRDTRYKQISASDAAKMLASGLISAEEFRRRMRNLGYTISDADLMTAKALKVKIDDDGGSPQEIDKAIGQAIRNRKVAKRLSDATLAGRLRQLLQEVARIQAEQSSRGGIPQPTAPDDEEDEG